MKGFMKKILWVLNAERCTFCETIISNQKVFVVRETTSTGLTACLGGNEPKLYEAVKCPKCGKQKIVGEYMRPITDVKEIEPAKEEKT